MQTNEYMKQIREEYPEYEDIDDLTLAKGYHKKHYSDLDENVFLDKIGLHQNTFMEDISDTASKVVDYFTPEPSYTQTDEETEPSLHNAIAPNSDGTMPVPIKFTPKKEETTLLQDTKDILFGTGEDYKNPNATEYELGKRVVNRVNELTANAIQGTYNLLGNIKSPMEYLGIQTNAMKEANKRRADWFKNASDNLNNFIQEENKLEVKPTHTWEEAKKAFKQDGVFSVDAWQELGNYIGNEGVASLPDMAEMVAMMPLYYVSRQQESAEKRAKNDGRNEPTKADYLATAPTVMGSIMLDKFSLNGMTTEVVERVGKEALKGSMKDVVKVIGSEMKKGTLKEGITEAIQNPLEMFGEELNTKKGLSTLGEYADNSLAGFVAGAGMGAGMSGTTATGTQIFNTYNKTKQDSLRDAYIQDAYNKQLLGGGIKTTIDKDELIEFSNALDAKVKTIQSEFENLVINNPDVEIPVEAVDNIEIQEVIVAGAKEQGLDVSSDGGLNAIDKGFKELEAEIGNIDDEPLTPKASDEPAIIEEPVIKKPEPEAKQPQELNSVTPALKEDEQGIEVQIGEETYKKWNSPNTATNGKVFKKDKELGTWVVDGVDEAVTAKVNKIINDKVAVNDKEYAATETKVSENPIIEKKLVQKSLTQQLQEKESFAKVSLRKANFESSVDNADLALQHENDAQRYTKEAQHIQTAIEQERQNSIEEMMKHPRIEELLDMRKDILAKDIRYSKNLESKKEIIHENNGNGYETNVLPSTYSRNYAYDFSLTKQDVANIRAGKIDEKIHDKLQSDLGVLDNHPDWALVDKKEQVTEFKSANELDTMKLRQKEILAQLRKKDEDKKDVVDEDLETTPDSYMKAPKKPNFELIGEPRDISSNTTEIHLADKTREIANINTKPIVAYLEELRSKHPESFNSVKDVFKHIIEVKNSATFILQGSNPSNTVLVKSINGITKKIGIEKNNDEINLLVHALISKKPNEIRRLIKRQLERSPTLSFHNEVDTANGNKLLSTASVLNSIPFNQQKKQEAENELYARSNGYDEAGANYIPTYGFSGLPARPKDGTITIGYREVTLPTLDNPMNADSVRVHLSDIVGNRLYEAKIKNKSALGKYQRKDSAIRVKNYSDMEVLAHEMAHYLDYFHNNKTKKADGSFFRKEIMKNKDEVKALSYTTDPKNVISEGFAEFVRLWLTNYNSLEMVAPKMVKDFENKLAKDKDLNTKMYNLQKVMHQYYYQGEHAMLRSKRGGELNSAAKKIQRGQAEISKDIRQKAIDKIHTIKRIEAEIKGDVATDAIDSAYKSLQLVNGHSSIMYSTMNNGVPTLKNGDISYSGKSLNDIFAAATKVSVERVRLLEDYLVAKRASELMKQGRENLITADEINAGLDLVNIYPEFKKIFDEYQEFNDGMLDFYVDMKMITTQQRENFQEMNKNYVPFNRVTESVQYGEVPPAKIGQRLTGGTHSLGNIMENIINGVESNIKEALISRGKSMFYEMLETSGMGGVYATKVSVEDKLVQSDMKQQAKKVAIIMSQLGVTVSKDGMILSGDVLSDTIVDVKEIEQNLLDNPSALEFWTHGHPPSSKGGSYIDSVIINDKKVYFETNDIGMVDALTSFKGSQYGAVVQGLMSVKNIMTWNITNNPLFYLTNFARDTVSAGVLSKNKFIPVMSSISGMYHFITKSKTFKEYMASGAGYGTRRTALGGDIQAMQMLNVNRGFEVVSKLISAMEYGADVFEYGTRVGEFALAQKAGKSNMQSAFEAREISTDFAIKGSNTTISGFMSTVPFMKAGLLGIDKTARRLFSLNGEMKFSNAIKFKNQLGELQKHKIKIYATGGIIAGLTLSLWFANRDDERYKKLTRDSKLMYWHFFIGKQHIKIPRPYDIGFAFASVPEIIADGIYTKHGEEAVKDFIWGTKTMFSIGDISGLFQPVLEDMTNTNWTGSPIVPRNMQNLDDLSDQYFSTTPLMYKELGKATGVSPIKAQHYVSGYLGLTAKMIEEATENILWNKKEWGARPFERNALEFLTYRFKAREVEPRSKYSEKYYELMQKASAVKASYDKKIKSVYVDGGKDIKEYMSDKEKKAYLTINKMLKKYNKNLTQIKISVEVVSYDKSLTKTQKENKINKAYAKRTEIFKNITMSLEEQLKLFEGK